MRGWILDESPGEYRLGEVETPVPGPAEVRIHVRASALNHIDLWLSRGMPRPRAFPHISGSDVAGVIDAVGPGVVAWAPGDEVVMAATVTSHEAILVRGIDNVIEPGTKVLIVGIGGGVAVAALHIAKYLGAEVYVTSRDEAKRRRALELRAVD